MRGLGRSGRRRAGASSEEDHAAALSGLRILAGTPPPALRRLADATERIDVTPGTDVVREGRVPSHFYVVGSGLLEVLSTGEGEHEPAKVTSLQEGDHFGEIGLLEGMPATATVRASTSCSLYRIPAVDFLAAVASSPALSSVLLERVAGGLAKTHPSYAPAATERGAAAGTQLLSDIARIGEIVGPALRPPGEAELLKAITATAMNLFGAAACSLALLRPDGSLEFKAASGAGGPEVVGRVVPAGAGIAGAVVASGSPLVIDDVERDERFAAAFASTTGYRPRSVVARPLESARGVVGVIEVLDGSRFGSDREGNLLLLDLFARLAATAIENGRAFSDFGVSLLAAAAEAADGTPLAGALRNVAAGSRVDPDALHLAELVQKVMERDPGERRAVIESLTARLGDGGPEGS